MLAACLGRPVFSVDLLQHVVWCRLILIILAAPWTLPKKMVSFNFLPRSDRVDLFMIGFIMRRGLFLNTGRWQDDVSPTRDHERRRLWQILSTSQLDTPIVLIVNQLILGGVGKIEHNQAENNKVAALCLQAARKATQSSAIASAISYVKQGISLVTQGTRYWHFGSTESHRPLCD